MLSVLIWWAILQIVALLALPITLKLLRFLPDRGFGFARPVGLLLTGYLFWLLTVFGILQNTSSNILLVLLGVGGASVYLWVREGREMLAHLRRHVRLIIATEAIFLIALVGFAVFRAYNPDIAATEKPMEFAFINGILRSRTFPPRDPWLAGYSISYYYFGYVIAAMLTKLSGIKSDVTFNLTLITLFSLTVNGAFSLVYNLVRAYLDRRDGRETEAGDLVSRAGLITGLFAAVFVALMGNLEGIFELLRARGLGSEALWRWLDVKNLQATPPSGAWYPTDMWWWWRASRVIHDRDLAGNSVEVIDEFPFFSFLLGDNHPHVLALPFVILALALALNLLLSGRRAAPEANASQGEGLFARLTGFVRGLGAYSVFDLALWALLLGSLGFLNTWDYPIYLAISVVVYAIYRQAAYERLSWGWLGDVITLGVALLGLGILFYLPFYLGFRSQAGGVGFVGPIKTRLHQYLLMLGTFILLVSGLLVAVAAAYRRLKEGGRLPPLALAAGAMMLAATLASAALGWWTAALVALGAGVAGVLFIGGGQFVQAGVERRTRLEESTLFALLLVIVGLLLTGSVEFIFLRDTFGTRMNTVFKFYYQAWVLLGLASAYGGFYVLEKLRTAPLAARVAGAAWGAAAAVLVLAGLSYTVAAGFSKAEGFAGQPTLDGTRYIAQYRADDYAAIQWLRANAPANAVMVEATGGSYTDYNWVSAHTGIPTLLGWGGHELQWRGNYDEPGRREPDIAAIYQSADAKQTLALLDKYGVDYVYLGSREQNKYHLNPTSLRKFDRIMQRVYEQGEVIIYGR